MPLRVYAGPFRKEYERRTATLLEFATGAPDRPTATEIHDLRVNIRRIQAMRELLPRLVRNDQGSKRFSAALKLVLRATSHVRDLDILRETLKAMGDMMPHVLLVNLENQRSDAAARARDALSMVVGVPQSDYRLQELKSKKLTKRMRKVSKRRLEAVKRISAPVLDDESRVSELHALRKKVKQLRYLLETVDRGSDELSVLTKSQEQLGSIHDWDVALLYIKENSLDGKESLTGRLEKERRQAYLEFVSYWSLHTETELASLNPT